MYPANAGVVRGSATACADCDGTGCSIWGVVDCCGGSWTGTPVRECRRGGIVERDWDVGVRMRRRRGLAMCFGGDFEGSR